MSVPHRKHTKGNGQNSGGREALKSRDKGTRRDRVVPGVATLDRSPDQSLGVRPSVQELRGTRRGGPPGWSTDQVGPEVHTLEWIFFRTCLQGLSLTVG